MFTGFSPETSEFFWELQFNNERPWFLEHKEHFERVLNTPFKELAKDTFEIVNREYPLSGLEMHASRIYRDARRLHGRGPYKDDLWFSIKNRLNGYNGPSFFFSITPKDYCYGMGFYCGQTSEMELFRQSVDANPARFLRLAEEINEMPGFVIGGEKYKRPKSNYGSIIDEWYNRKFVSVIKTSDYDSLLYSADLPDVLAGAYIKMMPMYEYLNDFCTSVME